MVTFNKYGQTKKIILGMTLGLTLVACEEGDVPSFMKAKDKPETVTVPSGGSVKTQTKDVEAPEVFKKTSRGLWDGRPSLGGVWVAHKDNKSPERVIIKNNANGKFVIGALFRRERNNPGPEFQLSSDAAEAIGAIAGSPVELTVTALKTVEVPVDPPSVATDDEITIQRTADDVKAVAEPTDIKTSSLEPSKPAVKPSTGTGGGLTTAIKPLPRPSKVASTAPASKPSAPKASASARYVQMGFFSVEANAKATLASMKAKGISGKLVSSTTKGKKFWRVLAGPANSKSEQSSLLSKVKSMGFSDAYLVKG